VQDFSFSFSANTGVFGMPLKDSDLFAQVASLPGSTIIPITDFTGLTPSGNNWSQNGDDIHWGTIRAHLQCILLACRMTLVIKWIGAPPIIFFSSVTSTTSDPGDQYIELNLSSWVLIVLISEQVYWVGTLQHSFSIQLSLSTIQLLEKHFAGYLPLTRIIIFVVPQAVVTASQ